MLYSFYRNTPLGLISRRSMKAEKTIDGYHFNDSLPCGSHSYLLPSILSELKLLQCTIEPKLPLNVFDLGCGNGSIAKHLSEAGCNVTGVDVSKDGIAHAKTAFPELNLKFGSAYHDLYEIYGEFPVVISLEVVEHLYDPRHFARTLYDLVKPGGTVIISTPYHGYAKNLVLALTGKMDAHFAALWDHGHIKFWSFKTLRILLKEVGFRDIQFKRVGRIPPLAKSMIAIGHKP